jgi:actin-like ATPase involved in cell morphogenesis
MALTPFLIGIDLGTTNCAVAFVDTRDSLARVELFRVQQLTAPASVEPRPTLPSFLYFPEPDEIASGAAVLPWESAPAGVVGVLARERGALAPGRQVSSAKSWLAHSGVDRRAAFLPRDAAGDCPRVSPVEASARYLKHMRDAWNATVATRDPALRFERQTIVLTVPASFDEEPRELTVEAARAADLAHLTLIEEPIAAFYAWMAEHGGAAALEDDEIALVCDVGGGTSDFSLIRIRIEAGAPAFERVAIGDHLLLGGDNLDLALAMIVERKMTDARPELRLAITQRSALRRACSAAKERLLSADAPGQIPITLLGAGRALVGASITSELTKAEVEAALEQFLPLVEADTADAARDRRLGLRELGLPFESDPAITRHLAGFLTRSAAMLPEGHRAVTSSGRQMLVRPDLVLFNGGFFTPAVARERVERALAHWCGSSPRLLAAGNPEAAVAIGAATYARLRTGLGNAGALVKAGSGRAYYVALRGGGNDDAIAAVCVLARGTNEGTEQTFEHPFTVMTNGPVAFSLYSSTIRPDRAGDIVPLDRTDVQVHTPLVTVLRYGKKSRRIELPVKLSMRFTELGTLELWCHSTTSDHRWRLQFQVRDATSESRAATPDDQNQADTVVIADEAMAAGEMLVRAVFASAGDSLAPAAHTPVLEESGAATPENIVALLEHRFGYAKHAWPLGALRRLADALIDVVDRRRCSAAHEARWLNLLGFCMRPGFGAAKDPWRITKAREVYSAGLIFANSLQNRVEWLVLWQRAAAGFGTGQQRELAQRIMGELGMGARKPPHVNPQIARESWRLLASLERLDAATRVKIGDEVLRRLKRDEDNASLLWSIARCGARMPVYGPLTSVVQTSDAARWLRQLIAIKRWTPELGAALVQIGAVTGDPLRDVDDEVLELARARLRATDVEADASRPLYEVVHPTLAGTSRAFGEPLPDGLRLDDAASVSRGDAGTN